jgi:hypothetical protein
MTSDTIAVPAVARELVRALVATANDFAASLDEDRRRRALMDFGAAERRDWHYVPRRRPGLPLRDMDENQRRAANALLRIGLSDAGGRKALAIMEREKVLKQADPTEHYDPLDYAFSVFGSPGQPPWAWSVEGHHLSLHFTILSETEVTVTPFFMGVAPLLLHQDEGSSDAVLLRERDLAFEIVHALDGQDRKQAIIADRSMGDILSGPGREESLRTPAGLPVARLADARREAVLRLVDEYLGRLRRELACAERLRLCEAGIENLHFAWAGGLDPGLPHYYRLHGPTLLVEYDNSQEQANHVHTVWHDPNLSFGDVLGDHYAHGHRRR